MSDIIIDRQTAHEVSKALHFVKGVIDKGLKENLTGFTPNYRRCVYLRLLGIQEKECEVGRSGEITPLKCLDHDGTCPDYRVQEKPA